MPQETYLRMLRTGGNPIDDPESDLELEETKARLARVVKQLPSGIN
jgi:hypothetical protein